jgi:hypothetical protein
MRYDAVSVSGISQPDFALGEMAAHHEHRPVLFFLATNSGPHPPFFMFVPRLVLKVFAIWQLVTYMFCTTPWVQPHPVQHAGALDVWFRLERD